MNFHPRFLNRFSPERARLCSIVRPEPMPRPELIAASSEMQSLLQISSLDPEVFACSDFPSGILSYATRYGGHQFGHWAGQLGDGRALLLGELPATDGHHYEIQLKGAGTTPYSRRGDGRAVLRSSLREFLCSEAMAHLRVPTTRALCCYLTGESVTRDMLYDGNPEQEPGAITTRVARSFLRFGHFEMLAADSNHSLLSELIQFTIEEYYPEIWEQAHHQLDLAIAPWFEEVCRRTAHLMTEWLRVGFVHGVMNTDNMSILGLTIDYGPYGWLDVYDLNFTPNTTDYREGRYRFGYQPSIAYWNLEQLLKALPLPAEQTQGLELYRTEFQTKYLEMMNQKLGLSESSPLIPTLDQALQAQEIDPTLFFRTLTQWHIQPQLTPEEWLQQNQALYPKATLSPLLGEWLSHYRQCVEQERSPLAERLHRMNQANPYFILRNYLVQEALEELARGQDSKLRTLERALKTPYEENEHTRPYFIRRPEWARNKVGSSALSCSS